MGITNFSLLLQSLKTDKIIPFDSILIDAQSLLYGAIDGTWKESEHDIMLDMCYKVEIDIGNILNTLFKSNLFENELHVVISFDGEGVPMKWPIQQKRRDKPAEGRNLYKIVLFGNNIISQKVYRHLRESLTNFDQFNKRYLQRYIPQTIKFILSGSNMEGEGEHKLFHIARKYSLKKPIIVSEDNDVFILAYKQFKTFESVQIRKKQNVIYNLRELMYDSKILVNASLLFGNDFIPSVVTITVNNFNTIHDALYHFSIEHQNDDLPELFCFVLKHLCDKSKIRYKKVPFVDYELILEFWKTCLWVLDYYTSPNFPQKFILNGLYDAFDRNSIVTALLDVEYSKCIYYEARTKYSSLESHPIENSSIPVMQLDQVKRFLITACDNQKGDIIEIKKST
ncbi:XRN_N domain-containing protein [Nephila pilipes]|uniref:XRN_N domain-containing protein n=1 Tax=Nephila pilipes TaxID=299642 RepID=A0A8X6MN87_NEPPI|nr:XRN_N domain-containing protein [Nephila pilipes]